jgi:GDP-4-dehydro-6-deoxy-D-mannose reductase
MRVLITGITGFAGSHLAEYVLTKENVELFGTVRWRSRMDNIEHIVSKISLVETDFRDQSSVKNMISKIGPDIIFHLAAQSFVPSSWSAPGETLTTNILGALYVFESIKNLDNPPKVLVSCSSEEYGMVKEDELPIKEDQPLRPLSPYGVSKVGEDLLGYQYFQSYKLPIYISRAFNHTGPRRGEVFSISNFAKQIIQIEKGMRDVISVGNLDAIRDFTDVRDTVRAYWMIVEKANPGEPYNVATGIGYKIGDILKKLADMAKVEIKIEKDSSRMRPSDVMVLIGDSTKLREETGWEPEITFDKTLEDLLNYWREKL